jgi:hypothetical protein
MRNGMSWDNMGKLGRQRGLAPMHSARATRSLGFGKVKAALMKCPQARAFRVRGALGNVPAGL